MSKGLSRILPDQDFLLPPSLSRWLPEGHLAYLLAMLWTSWDLAPMHRPSMAKSVADSQRHDPRMMDQVVGLPVIAFGVLQFAQDSATACRKMWRSGF